MKNLRLIAFILVATVIVGCEREIEQDIEDTISQEAVDTELTQNFTLLDWKPNIYHDYLAAANNEVGISSLKEKPFVAESVVSIMDEESTAKSGLMYKVNGKDLSTAKGGFDLTGLYGTNVSLSIEKRGGGTFKDGSTSKEVSMYIPNLVTITKPEILDENELLPHCYSKNLVLEWNADPENKEGLMVAAEYVGMSANPNMDKSEHIINTDFIKEDNGRWVIGEDLWAGIPDTGIVYLILLRGNVDLQEIDGELNKFFAETHAIATIILIKDLDSVE